MNVVLGYDFKNNKVINSEKIYYGNSEEESILMSIITALKEFTLEDFGIVSNTDKYLTLQYKEMDIVRVKYTERSKWISILILDKALKEKYINDSLFGLQKNKHQLQWKSSLEDTDISRYIEIIKKSCHELNKIN